MNLDFLTPYYIGLMPNDTLAWYVEKFPEHQGLKNEWNRRNEKCL